MFALLALLGYLIGSVPMAWALTWAATGRDLRRLGSGNVGVMNVALSLGRWAGLIVFSGEAGKGVAAVAVARALGGSHLQLGRAALAGAAGPAGRSGWEAPGGGATRRGQRRFRSSRGRRPPRLASSGSRPGGCPAITSPQPGRRFSP